MASLQVNKNIGYEALETEEKSRMKAGDQSLMLQKETIQFWSFLFVKSGSSTISSSAAFYHNLFIRSFVFYRQINPLIVFWLAWGISKSEEGLRVFECLVKKQKNLLISQHRCCIGTLLYQVFASSLCSCCLIIYIYNL